MAKGTGIGGNRIRLETQLLQVDGARRWPPQRLPLGQYEAAAAPAILAARSRGCRTESPASGWRAACTRRSHFKIFLKCFLDSYLSSSSLAPNSTKMIGVTQGCPGPISHLH